MDVVGHSVRPIDWEEKTTGKARYSADGLPENTLFAKMLRSPLPHARIRRIDLSGALKIPGVHAAISATDFTPGRKYHHSGEPYSDRPPLAVDRVLYVGQEIAAVAAETKETADQALKAIRVKYRRLRPVFSTQAALRPRAPKLHDRPSGTNIALDVSGVWGNSDAADDIQPTRIEARYTYPRVTHVCMEPNTTLAWWRNNRMELWTSSQAPHWIQREVAAMLGLDVDQVVCRDVAVGGGFGSKSKISEHEVVAAMLSMKTGRPVLLELSRPEEFAYTKPRHQFEMDVRLTADATNRLDSIDVMVDVDNGAYNHYGPGVMNAGLKGFGGMYRPDVVRWRGRLIDTNLTPGGQFRGYGQAQSCLALEGAVDELAYECGEDPLEFRIANASPAGYETASGALVGSNRLVECLDRVRALIDWDRKRSQKRAWRGVGVACGMHGSGTHAFPGSNTSAAGVEVTSDGDIVVRFGGLDAGTGQRTILGQIAAEVLGVDFDRVHVIMSDRDEVPQDMGAWSSRGTHMGGQATRNAAQAVADRLRELGSEKLGTSEVALRNGCVESADEAVEIGDLVNLAPEAIDGSLRIDLEYVDERMQPTFTGLERPNTSASYTFAAHAAEVEVDPATGEIKVVDYVAAHDIGRAIHPRLVKGQIYGGIMQAVGAALGENIIHEGGRVVNPSFLHYPVPRANTAPSIRVELVEGPEPAGPFDAKSVGEMSIMPPAPAVLNAVFDATGIRFRSLPVTPDVMLEAIRRRDGKPRRRYALLRRPGRWQIEAFRKLYPFGIHLLLDRIGTRFARRPQVRQIEAVHRPNTTDEAVDLLADPDSTVVGGATDLLVQRQQGLIYPKVLISTIGVPAMRTIETGEDGTVSIGAAVTLEELADWSRTQAPILAESVGTIASAQIRAVATVGGNLAQEKRCWFFRSGFDCYKRGGASCPCYAVEGDHRFYHAAIDAHRCQAVTPSDLATAFSALDAEVVVRGDGRKRVLPMSDLYSGPGEVALEIGELVESILIRKEDLTRVGTFAKIRQYEGDFAVVSVGVSARIQESGIWRAPRIVFGSLANTPWSPRRLLAKIDGTRPDRETLLGLLEEDFKWNAHPLPGNEWKLDAAAGLLGRAFDQLANADR